MRAVTIKKRARDVYVGNVVVEPTTGVRMAVTQVEERGDKLHFIYVNVDTNLIGWWDFAPTKMLIVEK